MRARRSNMDKFSQSISQKLPYVARVLAILNVESATNSYFIGHGLRRQYNAAKVKYFAAATCEDGHDDGYHQSYKLIPMLEQFLRKANDEFTNRIGTSMGLRLDVPRHPCGHCPRKNT